MRLQATKIPTGSLVSSYEFGTSLLPRWPQRCRDGTAATRKPGMTDVESLRNAMKRVSSWRCFCWRLFDIGCLGEPLWSIHSEASIGHWIGIV